MYPINDNNLDDEDNDDDEDDDDFFIGKTSIVSKKYGQNSRAVETELSMRNDQKL